MIRAAIISSLLLGGFSYGAESSSSSYADGSVVNYNSQSNNALDAELPYVTMEGDRVTCPTGKFTVAAIPTTTDNPYGHSDGATFMIGYSMPTDFNDTISRCKQQQSLMIRSAEWDLADRKMESDLRVIAACKKAFDQGFEIDSLQFEWAYKCKGMTFARQDVFMK